MVDISELPTRPGVYIFKGAKEKTLYVGKAKNLRNRVRSYFQESANLDNRKMAMVRMIRDLSYIVTDTELEALLLEANLIKQYQPPFNIILRDDKGYPYIKITIKEKWPCVEVVRKIEKDGNLYFGPYIPAQAMWEALGFIRRNFLIRPCKYTLDKPMRPCIEYQMQKCAAPCSGQLSREEYMGVVEDVKLFLMGKRGELIKRLGEQMQKLAGEMKYEEAAKVRDSMFNLKRALESQKVIAPELGDVDVVGFYRESPESTSAAIRVLFIRNGVMIGAKDFYLDKVMPDAEEELMNNFFTLFYTKEIIPPEIILLSSMPADHETLLELLKEKRGSAVKFEIPQRGKKFQLLRMANENAQVLFERKSKKTPDELAQEVATRLHLEKAPLSIGAFDVSTIQGSDSVGAFVFWEEGKFKKELYRNLRIRTVEGVDDYAMMRELVERTAKNLGEKMPDLIVIDGGRGQLETARGVLEECGIRKEVIGLAKDPDRAVLVDGDVVNLNDGRKSSLLLRRIRDEVHRFAISFHRKLRDKRLMESPLEMIPGINKKRRLELLRHFGSLERIRNASPEELTEVKGISKSIAEKIIEQLKQDKEVSEHQSVKGSK